MGTMPPDHLNRAGTPERPGPGHQWQQLNITFPDPATAQDVAARHLAPALTCAQEAGALDQWWFVRKQPWKLRYLADRTARTVEQLLTHLAAAGQVSTWATAIYEPEARAFGGLAAMDIAHRLFHHDSRYLLAYTTDPATQALGQRETTVLLPGVLLRGARLDWYEQGDVWAKVAQLRPRDDTGITHEHITRLTPAMARLMTTDTHRLCAPSRPLTGYSQWAEAFQLAGHALADLAQDGKLQRGLRAVLAHHVIFHANRAGLPVSDQAALAALAAAAVFGDAHTWRSCAARPLPATRVNSMTTVSDAHVPVSDLHSRLTGTLRDNGVITSPAIESAIRVTPRHLFLPGVPLDQAYADDAVYTKQDTAGVNISAASQPRIVAMMLGQLAPQPGHRVLEIGAGTGYNAALLAAITGTSGRVTTIDVDEDLVTGARAHLAAAGISNADVIHADGALGHPHGAPYDRIIATVGAFEVPPAWLDQLAPGGRLVVPLRLRGTASRSMIFERGRDGWISPGSELAVFMPLRGIGDDARRIVPLTTEKDVTLQVHKDQQAGGQALAGALDIAPVREWTGVMFPPNVPYEWMDLWLCLRLDNPLMRMNVQPAATHRGQITPMFSWGSMATARGSDLAYLTTRPAPPTPGGGKLYEVGVIGHGPGGAEMAAHVATEIRLWNRDYRARTVTIAMPDNPPPADPGNGVFILQRTARPITITWE